MARAAREDLFLDNVQRYGYYAGQNLMWPHVTDTVRPGRDDLVIEDQMIRDMTPQHAISALHKSIRWYQWLEDNGRFVQAGQGQDNSHRRRERHMSSPLVRQLSKQALGSDVWDAQRYDMAEDRILEIAINAVTEWETVPARQNPARRILILRDILTSAINQRREDATS